MVGHRKQNLFSFMKSDISLLRGLWKEYCLLTRRSRRLRRPRGPSAKILFHAWKRALRRTRLASLAAARSPPPVAISPEVRERIVLADRPSQKVLWARAKAQMRGAPRPPSPTTERTLSARKTW